MLSLFLALSLTQPPAVPSGPPAVPGVASPKQSPLSYAAACAVAVAEQKPLVVFVGTQSRVVAGAVVTSVADLAGAPASAVVVSLPAGDWLAWTATLPATATDAEIRQHFARKAVQPAAVPFGGRLRRTADGDGPYLPLAEQRRIRKAWPAGVLFPEGLKFYRLAPRYQKLWTQNNGTFHGWSADPLHDESHDFTVSGGMAGLDSSLWTSTKGIELPEGKSVEVWKEYADVRAFSLVPRWRWAFPVGTKTFDVLSNADGDVFEVRSREKTEEGWVSKSHTRTRTRLQPTTTEQGGPVRAVTTQPATSWTCLDGFTGASDGEATRFFRGGPTTNREALTKPCRSRDGDRHQLRQQRRQPGGADTEAVRRAGQGL